MMGPFRFQEILIKSPKVGKLTVVTINDSPENIL